MTNPLIQKLRKEVIDTARDKGIKNLWRLSRFVELFNDVDVLMEIRGKIPSLEKWRQSIKVTYSRTGKPEIELHEKAPREIGEALEDLVELALSQLGCNVRPSGTTIRDELGLPWAWDGEKLTLRFRGVGNLPAFKEKGKFENRGIVFEHCRNVRNKPDFLNEKIAIEVKNRDPECHYQTQGLFKREVLDRFKGVRKRSRYLIIPRGVLTVKQRRLLNTKGITVINLNRQLRRKYERGVYKCLFKKLKKILLTHFHEHVSSVVHPPNPT